MEVKEFQSRIPGMLQRRIRFKSVTFARDFIGENMNVAKELMAVLIGTPELHDFGKIPTGRSELVKWKGDRVAIYKDDGAVSFPAQELGLPMPRLTIQL